MRYKKYFIIFILYFITCPAMISSCSSNSSKNDKKNEKDSDNSGTSIDENKSPQNMIVTTNPMFLILILIIPLKL